MMYFVKNECKSRSDQVSQKDKDARPIAHNKVIREINIRKQRRIRLIGMFHQKYFGS